MKRGLVEITEGNIRNNHSYLASVIEMFPKDVIGGSHEGQAAQMELEIHFGCAPPVSSDIAGDKKIFRARGWVGNFFKAHGVRAGDIVVLEMTGPRRVHVYPARLQLA
jgi:hypothetical protein